MRNVDGRLHGREGKADQHVKPERARATSPLRNVIDFFLQRTSDENDIVQVCILDVILDNNMSLFCTVRNTRTVLQVLGPPRAAGPSVEAKSQAGRAAIGPRPRLLPE
jgi:hypothetical protein